MEGGRGGGGEKGFLHKINVTLEVNEKYKGERSVVFSNPFSSNNVVLISQNKK